jgi:hypothetical protein
VTFTIGDQTTVSRSSLIEDQPVELIGDQTTSKAINQCHQVVLVVGLVEIKLVQLQSQWPGMSTDIPLDPSRPTCPIV